MLEDALGFKTSHHALPDNKETTAELLTLDVVTSLKYFVDDTSVCVSMLSRTPVASVFLRPRGWRSWWRSWWRSLRTCRRDSRTHWESSVPGSDSHTHTGADVCGAFIFLFKLQILWLTCISVTPISILTPGVFSLCISGFVVLLTTSISKKPVFYCGYTSTGTCCMYKIAIETSSVNVPDVMSDG